jgi:3,4-dihydroxy 2-butanone 4-phosphate synthase/GTP cyclohydrolase II
VLAWKGDEQEDPHRTAERSARLAAWAGQRGLLIEREEETRLLALLDRPQVAVLVAAPGSAPLGGDDLAAALTTMAGWSGTATVSLLLAPDPQRSGHPSADLEPERRPLEELLASGSGHRPLDPEPRPGAFIVWQRAGQGRRGVRAGS